MSRRQQATLGLVVKHNANQRYATRSQYRYAIPGGCTKWNSTQDFVVRNDMGCGSTIGPILSANLGIRTVDVGIPQLSMHSVRECVGLRTLRFATDTSERFLKTLLPLMRSLPI